MVTISSTIVFKHQILTVHGREAGMSAAQPDSKDSHQVFSLDVHLSLDP